MTKELPSTNYFLTQIVLPMYVDKMKKTFINNIFPYPDNMRRFLTVDLYSVTAQKMKLVEAPAIYVALSHAKMPNEWEAVFAEFEESFVQKNNDALGLCFAVKGEEVRIFLYEKGTSFDGQETAFVCETKYNGDDNIHLNFGKTNSGVRMSLFAGKIAEILAK